MAQAIDWNQINTDLLATMNVHGSDDEVSLRNNGGVFTVKGSQGHRFDADMTAGLDQGQVRIRIAADHWDAQSPGRQPQKGDALTMWGRRHMIDQLAQHAGILRSLACE